MNRSQRDFLLALAAGVLVLAGLGAGWATSAAFELLARPAARLAAAALAGGLLLAVALWLQHALGRLRAGEGGEPEVQPAVEPHAAERERNRLAAVLAAAREGVLVCNLEGRILLYNPAARQLLGEEDFVGLHRSVFSLLDRRPLEEALERVRRGGSAAPVTLSRPSQVSSGNQLLEVVVVPVLDQDEETERLSGFALTLTDRSAEASSREERRRRRHRLLEIARAKLGSLRAAAETLEAYPDMAPERRRRLLAAVREDAGALSEVLETELSSEGEDAAGGPSLSARQLLAAAAEGLRRAGLEPGQSAEPAPELRLRVDLHGLLRPLEAFGRRLVEDLGVQQVALRLAAEERFAHLDLLWEDAALEADGEGVDRLIAWQSEALGGEAADGVGLKQAAQAQGGEAWFNLERQAARAYVRLLLPLVEGDVDEDSDEDAAEAGTPNGRILLVDSRPEYFDFDLFHQPGQTPQLEHQALDRLACTVFDTETTGLAITQGDELLSIGAVRIVNGRLLSQEVFHQLIDPRRPILPSSTRIHGLDAEAVRGQPTAIEALPRFERFAEDTVLVAHNAAFDMRVLRELEAAAGCRFPHPVLDTLLLSALAWPEEDDHRLEIVAARLGVAVVDRHTALGDAFITAGCFLGLLPRLRRRGITTLGEALAASESSYLSRLQY